MKSFSKIAIGLIMGASALAFSAWSASATVVCTGSDCWHAREAYEYPPEAHVTIHPDNWRWGPHERYVWREHEGRGYWHGGAWREF